MRFSTQVPDLLRRHIERCRGDLGMAAALAGKALAKFNTCRDWEIECRFTASRLPNGRVFLSGAGLSSQKLIAAIDAQHQGLQVVGVVDRRAAEIGEVLGRPVFTAQDAAGREFDYALVCNPVFEQSMVEDLLTAGVPRSRIHAVHDFEGFREFHDQFVERTIEQPLLAEIRAQVPRVEQVILVPSRDIWSVVDEAALAEVLPPATTIRLHFGEPGQLDPSPYFATFDAKRSLPLILRLLEQLRPQVVYVRGSAHFQAQHVAVAIKQRFPSIFLAFEVYDYMCAFDEEILEGWGFSPESVDDNRCAEALMGLQADFIIDKTPGDGWETLTAALFSAPRTAYFPRILPRPEPIRELGQACPRPAAADPWRLLSAGTIPPFKLYRPGQAFLNSAFQNIIGPIERLAGEDDFHIDLFNSGHVPDCPPAEQEFGGYRTLFPAGRVDYHCGIPFPDLLATMGQYHFGLLLFSDSEMVVDYPLQESLPNRFAGYVSGHLPIIVNQEVRYCASLVQAFNAGITVSVDELDDLPLRIRAADLEAMRAGVKALHAFMAERNRQALQAFRHHIRARPAREASFGT